MTPPPLTPEQELELPDGTAKVACCWIHTTGLEGEGSELTGESFLVAGTVDQVVRRLRWRRFARLLPFAVLRYSTTVRVTVPPDQLSSTAVPKVRTVQIHKRSQALTWVTPSAITAVVPHVPGKVYIDTKVDG